VTGAATTTPAAGGLAFAPTPPGRLGEAADPGVLLAYLGDLRAWVDQRKNELDGLDAAALRATDPGSYTGDVTLSMALWQSVRDRSGQLERLWDSGRANVVDREKMSQVIWGRLASVSSSGGADGMALSLAEGCRLSDALAAQLRVRLSFDPRASQGAVRVAALRAGLDRLRELVKQEPSWAPQVDLLAGRIDDVATRAARGADVDGVLGQLENDAARCERDLIVTTATKLQSQRSAGQQAAMLAADRVRASTEIAALEHREPAVRELAARCVAQVRPAPRFAVPEVAVLGEVPQGRAGLDAFLHRLGDVVRAMDVVERAYAAPLARRDELSGLFDAYRVRAHATGRDADPQVVAAGTAAHDLLHAVPCDLPAAAAAVTAYQDLVRGVTR
jgi:hypothetical protein